MEFSFYLSLNGERSSETVVAIFENYSYSFMGGNYSADGMVIIFHRTASFHSFNGRCDSVDGDFKIVWGEDFLPILMSMQNFCQDVL